MAALSREPQWILVTADSRPLSLMPAADLARYLQEDRAEKTINLGNIPAQRQEIKSIDFRATLQEALVSLSQSNVDALYVIRRTIPGIERIYGIVTRKAIDRSYRIE
jgi:hypothetical protein